jgi:hypothetical protein
MDPVEEGGHSRLSLDARMWKSRKHAAWDCEDVHGLSPFILISGAGAGKFMYPSPVTLSPSTASQCLCRHSHVQGGMMASRCYPSSLSLGSEEWRRGNNLPLKEVAFSFLPSVSPLVIYRVGEVRAQVSCFPKP